MQGSEKMTDHIVFNLMANAGLKPEPEKTQIHEVQEALKTASKRLTNKTGKPEFIAMSGNYLIIVEDKAKNEHQANYMADKDDTLLMDKSSVEKYAENGALHYAQHITCFTSFTLYAPREYLSRAYHDAPKYCATIETAQVKKDEVVFTGEIPARCIQAYRTDLAFYTNGRSVCLTELKGYQAAVGQPVIQPRRPNSRLDKVRHMFQKVM